MIGFVALVGAYATTGQIIPVSSNGFFNYWKVAEKVNGSLAMLGLVIGNQLRTIRMDNTSIF